ncbi:MAG TPA: winged helix-turn-helix transcriptional regulator [Clostridia bacterium]
MRVTNIDECLSICSALSSQVRVDIIKLLLKNKSMNLDNLAKILGLTNGAITAHVKKLMDAGLINVTTSSGVRGSQKLCSLAVDKIIIDVVSNEIKSNSYDFEVDVGHYSDYEVYPTCGIATKDGIIGEFDDPRYFSYPERFNAGLLWFSEGFVEYKIPNALKPNQKAVELQFSFEIASEALGSSPQYPSDIYFSVNGIELGYWTSPGEFNDRPGIVSPSWWYKNLGQYGRFKMLIINKDGTFIDGLPIGSTTIDDLNICHNSNITFRISAPKKAANKGGVTLFGKTFGDYPNGIKIKLIYENLNGEH